MKLPRFRVVIESKDFTSFLDGKNKKEVDEYLAIFKAAPLGTSIKIYEKDDCIYHMTYEESKEDKFKIGF